MTTYTISAGVVAGHVLNNGDYEIVSSGGVASGTIANNGGTEVVYSSGAARGTTVNSGGRDYVESGGLATGTTVNYGGQDYVDAGGVTNGTTVNGGEEVVSSGGVASGTTVNNGGYESISSGGIASGTIINSGGSAFVYSGATVTDMTVNSGGALNQAWVDGAASGLVANGPAMSTAILSGNTTIQAGAVVQDLNIVSGGHTTGTAVNYGGVETVSSGGVASGTAVSGGTEYVSSGGVASGTTVGYGYDGGGAEVVYSGGLALGTIVSSGGSEVIYSGGVTSGTIVNAYGSETVYSGGIASGATINSSGVQILASGAIASNTHILAGGSIDVNYLTYNAADAVNVTPGGLLTVTNAGTEVYSQQLSGDDYTGNYFHAVRDTVDGSLLLTENDTPCYCPGTLIETDKGEVPVEALQIGDRVRNHKGEARPIKWIGKRSYAGRFIMGRRDILPICFEAGSIGETVSGEKIPRRDLWVSPHHAMYLNGVLIEAKDLANGVSIYQADGAEDLEYFHIELDSHDVIIAEGAYSESFIDDDNRGLFHNSHEYGMRYPGEAPIQPRYYAPRINEGLELEDIRADLLARAKNSCDRAA